MAKGKRINNDLQNNTQNFLSFTNKADFHDINEIMLKVTLKQINSLTRQDVDF
jgi:hypothetical protein